MTAKKIYIAYSLIWCAIISPVIFSINDPQAGLTTQIIASVISGLLIGFFTYPIVTIIKPVMFGVKLKSLFTSEKELHDKMLRYMNYVERGGIKGALEGLNQMFRAYPEWDLHEWIPFKAGYKHEVDYMCQRPEIYGMSFKGDGSPYIKEKDSLYDPEAPDWESMEESHLYDYLFPSYDDDDDDDDDYDDYDDYDDNYRDKEPDLKKAMKDGFAMGIGFGLANSILHGGNNSN